MSHQVRPSDADPAGAPALRSVLTLVVFGTTLVLVFTRPRGVGEAFWALAGGGALLALGLVTPGEVAQSLAAGQGALLFLLGLLLLSALLEQSGFFRWAAVASARLARGDAHALYRNVFLLGALITALLSLDTTAVILTPVVLACVLTLKLPARPYVLACAFVANTASLLLPISNLTNLLLAGAFRLGFGAFAARMALPQAAALLVNYGLFRWWFRRELPARFAVDALPDLSTTAPNRRFFWGGVVVLALVFVGYFVGPAFGLPPYVFALTGSLALALWAQATARLGLGWLRGLAFSVFPFVIGLFVLVRGLEKLEAMSALAGWLSVVSARPWPSLWSAALGAAVGSNAMNNLPAALLARSLLLQAHATQAQIYGVLLGTNLGPNATVFGSLATMLVIARARQAGVEVRGRDLLAVGLVVTPLLLVTATVALGLVLL